jgi:hypothetical protein
VTALVLALAAALALFFIRRRRRPGTAPVPVPVPSPAVHVNLGDALREMLPLDRQNDPEAVRDFQSRWLRDRQSITADSVLETVQVARASITHVAGAEAHAVLDDLQRQANEHPEGVPGHIVAGARLRFDEILRGNLQ